MHEFSFLESCFSCRVWVEGVNYTNKMILQNSVPNYKQMIDVLPHDLLHLTHSKNRIHKNPKNNKTRKSAQKRDRKARE